MHYVLHPIQGLATFLRALSTGISIKKILEYDRDFLEMISDQNQKVYASTDEAIDDILDRSV